MSLKQQTETMQVYGAWEKMRLHRDRLLVENLNLKAALSAIIAEVQDDGSLMKCAMIADTALTQANPRPEHE